MELLRQRNRAHLDVADVGLGDDARHGGRVENILQTDRRRGKNSKRTHKKTKPEKRKAFDD